MSAAAAFLSCISRFTVLDIMENTNLDATWWSVSQWRLVKHVSLRYNLKAIEYYVHKNRIFLYKQLCLPSCWLNQAANYTLSQVQVNDSVFYVLDTPIKFTCSLMLKISGDEGSCFCASPDVFDWYKAWNAGRVRSHLAPNEWLIRPFDGSYHR